MKHHAMMAVFLAFTLTGCGGAGGGSSGAKTVLTEAQFAEVKANCNLGDATLSAANSTVTTTDANGVTSTVQTTYTDSPPDAKTITLPSTMSEGDAAQALMCLHGEFERLGAEARLSVPGVGM